MGNASGQILHLINISTCLIKNQHAPCQTKKEEDSLKVILMLM